MTSKFTLLQQSSKRLRSFVVIVLLCAGAVGHAQSQTMPKPDHIVILIEENEPNAWVVGDGPECDIRRSGNLCA